MITTVLLILSAITMQLSGMDNQHSDDTIRPLESGILARAEKLAAQPVVHPTAPITFEDISGLPSNMEQEILRRYVIRGKEAKTLEKWVSTISKVTTTDRAKRYTKAFQTILNDHKPLTVLLMHLTNTPECARTINYANAPADYSNDGTLLVLGNQHRVSLWDTQTYSCLHTIIHDDQQTPITCVSFNPTDSNQLLTSSERRLQIWHHPTKIIKDSDDKGVTAIAWNDAGDQYDAIIALRRNDLDAPMPVTLKNILVDNIENHTRLLAVAYYNDKPLKIYQTWQRQVNKPPIYKTILEMDVISRNTLQHVKNVILKGPRLTGATYKPEQENIALISPEAVYVRPLRSANMSFIAHVPDHIMLKALFSPTGKSLITASRSTKNNSSRIFISFWDVAKQKCTERFALPSTESSLYSMAMHPNCNQLFTGGDQHGHIWNFSDKDSTINKLLTLNGKQVELLEGIEQAIKDRARIHPDKDQWETFTSLPKDFQEKLKLYIKTPESVNNNNNSK